MIVGRLSKIESYGIYDKEIKQALTYLKELSSEIPIGSYTISDRMYANVMEYQTHEDTEAIYEAHRAHLDIHFVLLGEERIKWASIENLSIYTPYDSENDAAFYKATAEDGTQVSIKGDMYAVMFPLDGHACQYSIHKNQNIKKVVVKILL